METWSLTPRELPPDADAPLAARFALPGLGGACAWLAEHGVAAGARVGVSGANTPAIAALNQACLRVGAALAPINHRLLGDEARAQADAARLDLLAIDAASRGDLLTHPRARALPTAFADEREPPAATLAADAPALVLFTSGSSGAAKAARLSRAAIDAAVRAAIDALALTRDDVWLACLPLDHVGGAMTALRAGACGCRLELLPRFDAAACDAAIDARGVTGVSVVPTMLRRLVERRAGRAWPRALRLLLTGGGPLDDATARASAALGLAPAQTYGLTESASMATVAIPPRGADDAGMPLPGVGLRVADPGADGVGRIELRGATLFDGYEGEGALIEPRRRDAWFDTGDLGALVDGRLVVHCRREDRIATGGEKVAPAEVEAALLAHPAVAEAAVFGVPDVEWGQAVVALLVANGRPAADAALADHLARVLAPFKRPRRWRWVAALPRTAAGKVARRDLPRAWAAASAS